MAYPKLSAFDLSAVDKDMLTYWEEKNIFQRTIDEREKENTYVFYEGPPSANGMPGIHHVMARTVKDLFCRYQTLKGKRVERRGGWDTHGLPIEINVEKELGITKDDIGKTISVEEYNAKCRSTVMRFKDVWDDITRRMAYWVDLEHPYITFENDYIESVWNVLHQLYGKEYLYKGYTIQPYSPAAGTGLSSHELNLPGCYKEVSDTSITAQFKVIRDERSVMLFEGHDTPVYFLAWTTTPWTLPANCALAIGKKIDYVLVETFNPYTKERVAVVVAEDRLNAYIDGASLDMDFDAYDRTQKKAPARVLKTFNGADLVGIRYEQLMPYVQPSKEQPGPDGDAWRVIPADFVTTADGSGIVHTASVFGADDYRACLQNNVPSILVQRGKDWIPVVDRAGRFVDEITDFAGAYVRAEYYSATEQAADGFESTDVKIAVMLKKTNRAFKVEKYVHNYPHCWRTDKPVLYYPLDSWFVRASAARTRMAELNQTINWKPAHTGTKRFQVWLENLQDWNLSRSRYWGIPLPIWRTEDAEEELCIGSYAQLTDEISKANEALGLDQSMPEDVHKPYIDDIVLVSPSGKEMRREADLIDVWFDSGSMPYAQYHYPFENQEIFERNFPADFIAEGVDQTRGWFYSLHAIAVMTRDSVAYKNVVSNGLVLDAQGQKMSKSKGNVVDPFRILDTYGIDATRWYLMTNANPWDNLRFDEKGIEEIRRKFFGTLYNTYSFFTLYANIDKFDYSEPDIAYQDRPEIDRWILSQLHQLIQDVDQAYSDYEPTQAGRMIQSYTEDLLSNWYVRLNRRRFWKGDYGPDKVSAYQTLHTCLTTIARIMSPIAPSYADWLYQSLTSGTTAGGLDSVHLTHYPTADKSMIDQNLMYRMQMARKVSSLTLSLRKKHRLRVRQPLQRIIMPSTSPQFNKAIAAIGDIIKAEVNVKSIELLPDDGSLFKKRGKPNFKTLGRRLGKDMKAAQQAINAMTADEIDNLLSTGTFELTIEDRSYTLTTEDIETYIEDIPGWEVATEDQLVVALDTQLDDALIAEGIAKEIIHGIQNLRKDSGLDVLDRIQVIIQDNEHTRAAVSAHETQILQEVLGDGVSMVAEIADGHEVTLADGDVIRVGLAQV